MLLGSNATKPAATFPEKPVVARVQPEYQQRPVNRQAIVKQEPQAERLADKQILFDLFERPPKDVAEIAAQKPQPAKTERAENLLSVNQGKPVVVDQNNPLRSQENQNYIAEKLNQHRQSLIDQYGSSKVPTPVMNVIKPIVLSSDDQSMDRPESEQHFEEKNEFMNYDFKESPDQYLLESINRDP